MTTKQKKEAETMAKHLITRGLVLGITAGILTALFDGLFMLIPNLYVPYSYPIFLITFNTLFWMTIGGLSGFFLWIFIRKREGVQGKGNFYWTIFFLLPLALLYGLLGRLHIPPSLFTIEFGGKPVFDHHLSFLWVSLILVFLAFYFRKFGNKETPPPVFFAFEIVTFILLFQFCSNLLQIRTITGFYSKHQIFFQDISLEKSQFLIAVYILGVLSIVGFYFFAFFKIRPFIRKKLAADNICTIAILFLIVSGCLTSFFTWSNKKSITEELPVITSGKNLKTKKISHVIIIVLDTVRADRLSIYGNPGATKNLGEFSKDSLVFENCIASSSWTLPSHASLFTGLYPSEHGAQRSSDSEDWPKPLSDKFHTLAEIFKDNNYKTGAVVSNHIALHPWLNIDQGFQVYNCRRGLGGVQVSYPFRPLLHLFCYATNLSTKYLLIYRIAEDINKESFRLLDKLSPHPFFLFINYMDAHVPYYPPPPFDGFFLDTAFPQLYRLKQYFLHFIKKTSKETRDAYQLSLYDGEIASLDDQLGKLFSRLKQMGIYDSSLIIVTSDHGELLGEHGLYLHGGPMYEGAIKIPLVIKFPYSKSVGREKRMITLADLCPTILSICGLPIPDRISGKVFGVDSSPVVSEVNKYGIGEHRILYDGKYKYMRYEHKRPPELYDLENDPMEKENLAEKLPEVTSAMERNLKAWKKAHKPKHKDSAKIETTLPKEVLQGMKALGYIK